jgi:uncharacterized protein
MAETRETALKTNTLLLPSIVLGVGLVVCSAILAGSLQTLKPTTIRVVGAASRVVAADKAAWTIELVTRQKDEKAAYKQVVRDRALVEKFLVAQGIARPDIQVEAMSKNTYYVQGAYGATTSSVESTEFRQYVQVNTTDVKKVTQVALSISDLVNQGVQFNPSPPRYLFTQLDPIKIQMVGEATQNAKKRAEAIAKYTGANVGVLTNAETGVFQITSPNSNDVSDLGIVDETSMQKKVTAVVNATFMAR